MRTLEDYTQNIEIPNKVGGFGVIVEIVVKYNRHLYKFESYNWQACNRVWRKDYFNDKVQVYGYTLKGAYEAFYKEFAKLHKVHSDKLTEIIR